LKVTYLRRVVRVAAVPIASFAIVAASTISVAAWDVMATADCSQVDITGHPGQDSGTSGTLQIYAGDQVPATGSSTPAPVFTTPWTKDANGKIHVIVKWTDLGSPAAGTKFTATFLEDHSAKAHFSAPEGCQTTTASSPRTNTPGTPAPSGGGAATPGLPNTGFDPNA
jgi:hypothetical protein